MISLVLLSLHMLNRAIPIRQWLEYCTANLQLKDATFVAVMDFSGRNLFYLGLGVKS